MTTTTTTLGLTGIDRYETLTSQCNPGTGLESFLDLDTREECAKKCDMNPRCMAFGGNGKKCYLKSACSGEAGPCDRQWCTYRLKGPFVDTQTSITLKEAAKTTRTDFLIGVGDLDPWKNNDASAQAALAHFNFATAGNVCKYTAIQKSENSYDFTSCDGIKNVAVNSMAGKFRLHALAWGEQNKQWLLDLTPERKRQNLIDSIREVVLHYGADAWAIDVVNEAIVDDTQNDVPQEPFRTASSEQHLKSYSNLGGVQSARSPHPWYPDVRDYIDIAFTEARRHCASCKLFYNDYNVEGAGGPNWIKIKSDRLYEATKGMLSRGLPIDGVGLQFHIELERVKRPSISGIKANIERFANLGLEVHITEIDIKVSPPWSDAKELEQAKLYAEILHACLGVPKCTAFTVWGLRDADSWLLSRANVVKPLLFDDEYKPKLAVPYMVHVLQGKGIIWTPVDDVLV